MNKKRNCNRSEQIRRKLKKKNIGLINEKKGLKNLRNHRLLGRMVRSRAKWAYEGEKFTIFFNLDNRHL